MLDCVIDHMNLIRNGPFKIWILGWASKINYSIGCTALNNTGLADARLKLGSRILSYMNFCWSPKIASQGLTVQLKSICFLKQCTEVHFANSPFWWIYYCHSSKSTEKETGKTHLCAVFAQSSVGTIWWQVSTFNKKFTWCQLNVS